MPLELFQHPQQATVKCPRCHQDICDQEPELFIGEQPFHRNCWIRRIMGPAENYGRGMPIRKDAMISVLEKRRSG